MFHTFSHVRHIFTYFHHPNCLKPIWSRPPWSSPRFRVGEVMYPAKSDCKQQEKNCAGSVPNTRYVPLNYQAINFPRDGRLTSSQPGWAVSSTKTLTARSKSARACWKDLPYTAGRWWYFLRNSSTPQDVQPCWQASVTSFILFRFACLSGSRSDSP